MNIVRNSGNRRRVFICRIAAVSMLPAAIGASVWAADCSQGGAVLPDMDESGAENLQPLAETLGQDVFFAARVLLAQQYRDQQTRRIDCPISFLQRNLRVSYRKACRLADALEKIGDWSSAENNSRTIYCSFVT